MGTRNDAEQSLLFVESRRAIYLMDSLTTILLTIFFRGSDSIFVGGSRRRFGVSSGDGIVRRCACDDEGDGVGFEHCGRFGWRV